MIKLAAFDLDGTIGETIPMCIEAFRKAVSPYSGIKELLQRLRGSFCFVFETDKFRFGGKLWIMF